MNKLNAITDDSKVFLAEIKKQMMRTGARSIKPKFPVRIFENFFVKWNGNFPSVSFHARAG